MNDLAADLEDDITAPAFDSKRWETRTDWRKWCVSQGYMEPGLRVGDRVRIRLPRMQEALSNPKYGGIYSWLENKVGVIIDNDPEGWDALVHFEGTPRKGGMFAFFDFELELVP